MPYVTGPDIIAQAGVGASATADDSAWAVTVAAALEAVITRRMAGVTITADITAELERAALIDGLAAYTERRSPHGIISMGDGVDVARLGARITRDLEPVFFAYAGPGIG